MKRFRLSLARINSLAFLLLFALPLQADSFHITASELQNTPQEQVMLDCRSPELYAESHLPGAINFPESWTYHHKRTDGRIVKPARIQKLLQRMGITKNTPVVIYDRGDMLSASRLFWTLEVYGLKRIKVLDKGYKNWLNLNLPTTQNTPETQSSRYVPSIDPERLATKLTTQIATQNPSQIIVDARSNKAYQGLISSAKRFGHIPGAINIPAQHNLESNQNIPGFKSLKELSMLYAQIPKQKKVILYCAIGRASTTNYLALRELGYNVANYDASWKEWANDLTLPIEK